MVRYINFLLVLLYFNPSVLFSQSKAAGRPNIVFILADERLPKKIRNEMMEYGSYKDEFKDNGGTVWARSLKNEWRVCDD